jgi:hypothetical protein
MSHHNAKQKSANRGDDCLSFGTVHASLKFRF